MNRYCNQSWQCMKYFDMLRSHSACAFTFDLKDAACCWSTKHCAAWRISPILKPRRSEDYKTHRPSGQHRWCIHGDLCQTERNLETQVLCTHELPFAPEAVQWAETKGTGMKCMQHTTVERCSKLQLKLNGNYSSLREILAPSLRDHNGSLRAVNFSNWACATLREDEFLRFGAFLLLRCRHEADFGLGFLGFSDSLGSLGCFSASRLLGLSGGFSTSRLQSTQFLFCQQCSPWMPPVSVWPWARVQSVQWHGSQSVQWFCLVSRSERA